MDKEIIAGVEKRRDKIEDIDQSIIHSVCDAGITSTA